MSGMGQPPPTSVTATFRTIHQGVLYGQPIPASHSAGLGRHATVWQQLAATNLATSDRALAKMARDAGVAVIALQDSTGVRP